MVGNHITGEDPPSDHIAHLLLTGSQQCAVYDNTINGTSNGDNGLRVVNSFRNNYCCNTFNKLEEGIVFSGFCGDSQFRQTTFTGPFSRGLSIGESTILGQQEHAGNLWNGTFGEFGAVHEDPFPQNVFTSQFIVDPQDGNALPTFMAATSDWFSISSGDTPFCSTKPDCGIPLLAEEINSGDIRIAQGLPNSFRTGVTWEGEQSLVQKLNAHPELLNLNTDVDNFYASAINQNSALFSALEQSIRDLYQVDGVTATQLNQKYDAIALLLNQIQFNEYSMVNASPTDSITLNAAKVTLLNTLKTNWEELTIQKEVINLARQQTADQLKTHNNLINTQALYESNEKSVNAIFLDLVTTNDFSLVENETALLENIANQCPLDGGNAVFQARSLLRMLQGVNIDDESNCVQTASTNESDHQKESLFPIAFTVDIFPIPAKETLFIKVTAAKDDQIEMFLYNSVGVLVLKESLDNGRNNLNTTSFATGIYLLQVSVNGQPFSSEKVSIIH